MMKQFSMSSFIAGAMLGALLVAGWSAKETLPLPLSLASTSSESAATSSKEESGAVSVLDQPAGPEVTIESVTVPPPGVWIAVRDVNGTDLGNVLGAAHVSGPRMTVSIPLLRKTEPGLSYAVQLYRNDGRENFDLAHDSVYVDFNTGEAVIAYFTTTK